MSLSDTRLGCCGFDLLLDPSATAVMQRGGRENDLEEERRFDWWTRHSEGRRTVGPGMSVFGCRQRYLRSRKVECSSHQLVRNMGFDMGVKLVAAKIKGSSIF